MKGLAVLLLCMSQWACNPGREPVVESQTIRVLHSSSQCIAGAASGIRLIGNPAELAILWQDLHRMQLDSVPAPAMDFHDSYLVLINMGQQSTAGYVLEMDATAYVLRDHVAVIPVLWKEPEPGSMQAQVITSPCLLLQVPKGRYTEIEVVDQQHRLLFRHAV